MSATSPSWTINLVAKYTIQNQIKTGKNCHILFCYSALILSIQGSVLPSMYSGFIYLWYLTSRKREKKAGSLRHHSNRTILSKSVHEYFIRSWHRKRTQNHCTIHFIMVGKVRKEFLLFFLPMELPFPEKNRSHLMRRSRPWQIKTGTIWIKRFKTLKTTAKFHAVPRAVSPQKTTASIKRKEETASKLCEHGVRLFSRNIRKNKAKLNLTSK